MATITLTGVWVALASDLSAGIFAGSVGSMGSSMSSGSSMVTPRSDVRSTKGAVRQYANGTFRTVSTVGVLGTYTFTLRMITWAECQTLAEVWVNQTVLVRDRAGRQWYGSYNSTSITDYPGGSQLHDTAFVFHQTSYSDAVLVSVPPA